MLLDYGMPVPLGGFATAPPPPPTTPLPPPPPHLDTVAGHALGSGVGGSGPDGGSSSCGLGRGGGAALLPCGFGPHNGQQAPSAGSGKEQD
jgi:hypothetical protein